MALTTAQYNQHVYDLLIGAFPVVNLHKHGDVLHTLLIQILRRLVEYHRLGIDQDEAAKRLAIDILTALKGSTPTTADLHLARNHWIEEAFPGAVGEI